MIRTAQRRFARAAALLVFLQTAPILAQVDVGFSQHEIVSAGTQRSYLLYVPSSYRGDPVPLVLSFHGSGGVPQNQVGVSGFDALADAHGFAAVFPAGVFANTVSARSWNANVEQGADDVQFARDVIASVGSLINVDSRRIYASGMSGGARMSSRLACELSDVLAAAAPVAGLQYPDGCTPQRPVPIITFHGKADGVNQYTVTEDSRPYWRMGVETALDKWRQADGCSLANDDDRLSQHVSLYRWNDCGGSAEIHFYVIDNGGHTWPGSSPGNGSSTREVVNQDIDASELIWQFFSKHSLP